VKRIIIILFLAIQSYFLTAQTTSIDSLEVCAAQEVLLPVKASNLLNVGALTLYVGFDTTNLTFISVENIDPQIQGMTINLMTNPTQLAFAWSNTLPVNFSDNKMFDIKFHSNGNTGEVIFNSNCEISDTGGVVLAVNFLDGIVSSGLPVILMNPANTLVVEGSLATFNVSAENTLNFSWRESQDNGSSWLVLDDNEIYSGTKTPNLNIHNTPLDFDGYLYQCVLSKNACQLYSNYALLNVDELTSVKTGNEPQLADLIVSPVPCHDFLSVKYKNPFPCDVEFVLSNEGGQPVKRFFFRQQSVGFQYITLPIVNLAKGLYILNVYSFGDNRNCQKSFKIVKN
jgi:hypothetical protein